MYLLPESVSFTPSLPTPKPSPGVTVLRGRLGGFIKLKSSAEDCVSLVPTVNELGSWDWRDGAIQL